jgi:EmrB/QacA subfamily drug resistance transporter
MCPYSGRAMELAPPLDVRLPENGHMPMDGSPAKSSASDRRRGDLAVLLTASLVSSLIMLDSNIVAVSLPAIARSLHARFADVEWVISAYLLTFASLLLPAGAVADRFGRRRSVLVGLVVFCVASAACGAAESALVLSLARAAQGLGGALLLTSSIAVLGHTFESGPRRARAWAVWGSALGAAITSGPIVGGVITSYLGWRWAFLINVPLCALLFLATLRFVPESRDPAVARPDTLGVITFTAALSLMTWALIEANGAAPLAWTLARAAGALLMLILFVLVERRHPRPLMDLSLFANRTFLVGGMAMIGYAAGAQVLLFYLPLYLQSSFGLSALRAGLGMLPFALPLFLVPRVAGWLATRMSARALLALGMSVVIAGDLALSFTARGLSYPWFAVAMAIAGCGAGLLNGETTRVQIGAAPADRAGMASGVSATTRFIGLLVAIAAVGAVLSRTASAAFAPPGLDSTSVAELARRVISGDVPGAVANVPVALRDLVTDAARRAFAEGFAAATLLCAGVAAVTLALILVVLPRERLTP